MLVVPGSESTVQLDEMKLRSRSNTNKRTFITHSINDISVRAAPSSASRKKQRGGRIEHASGKENSDVSGVDELSPRHYTHAIPEGIYDRFAPTSRA